jgi:hypothetical protein
MSVNINIKPTSNDDKWAAMENGDFAILSGNKENPIPEGLYRVFMANAEKMEYFAIPMFEGPFEIGMYPYMISLPRPPLKCIINTVHIDIQTN